MLQKTPMPSTLKDAIREIEALRKQLITQNALRAKAAERYAIELRSLKGMLRKRDEQLRRLKSP